MFKKIISSILAVAMVAAMSTTVFATEGEIAPTVDVQEEIQKAIAGISDVPITTNISEGIVAEYIDSEGKAVELEVQTTITRLPKYSRSMNEPDRYAITAYVSGDQKVETGSGTNDNNNILATGSFTMLWIDGKGADTFKNVIERLYGNWETPNPDNTKFKEGSINWGDKVWSQAGFNSVSQSFNQSINYTSTSLGARSRATFTKVVNGVREEGEVKIELAPSIFD